MIKKWVEYIKESFEKVTHTENDVYKYTLDLLDSEIDSIFIDVHQEFNTSSGDITPGQVMELDKLKERLAKLITEQVCANIELENQKSNKIDLVELSQLEDERLEVKEGDEVIAVYTGNNYIKNAYKFKVEKSGSKLGSYEKKEKSKDNWEYTADGELINFGGKTRNIKWYDLNDADLVIKVDTYNDFVRGDKRL